jgi:hypothetical protein
MQIGAKGIKTFKKKTQFQKYTFPFLFTWESPKLIQFGTKAELNIS